MKILLYVNGYLPKIGGRELVVHTLAKEMQQLGHDVHVAGPGGVRQYRGYDYGYPLHRWFKVPFIGAEPGFVFHLLRMRLRHKFDVIHAHTTYPTGYMAAKLKRVLGARLVITPHGNDINVDEEIGHGLRLNPQIDRKIRFALSKADAVTAISDQVGQSLQAAGVAAEDIISLPNGVDVDRFQTPQNIDVRKCLGLAPTAKLVVTIGNYHRRKGHEVLIDAVRRAREVDPDLCLVIVGAKSEELVECTQRAGFADWLVFAGTIQLPRSDGEDMLAALLQSAGVYVSSSISNTAEGMSLALLEAMAAATCVIASDISGSADLLDGGKYGVLVPAKDASVMSERILQVFSDDAFRARYQQAALTRAKDFSWGEISKRYIEVYQGLLKPAN